jgi:hypothetical protein
MKKIILLFFVILSFQSCQYFEKNVPNKEELLDQELKKVNWSEVDDAPSVLLCDSIMDKNERKQCFFNFISQTIQQRLLTDSIRVNYSDIDTLQLKVTVSPEAIVTFESQLLPNHFQIDSLLQIHLANLPLVEPAIKRGVKVKSEFMLPIVLNVGE